MTEQQSNWTPEALASIPQDMLRTEWERRKRKKPANAPFAFESEAIERLSRDLKQAAKQMGLREARYFVNTYYDIQDYRIASANQQRKLLQGEQPSESMSWLNSIFDAMETDIKSMLDKWSAEQHMGKWARQIVGIGPVISAGLIAHIDITKAPTVGHIWSFAGLNPNAKWEPNTRRPWNASLKRLCWLIGESFVKVSSNPRDIYGKLYLGRKVYECQRNDAGMLAEVAKKRLEEDKRRRGKKLDAGLVAILESGKLPQIAMHERSKRWAVKLFLSHWHAEAYREHYKKEPPKPYPIAFLGHVHEI